MKTFLSLVFSLLIVIVGHGDEGQDPQLGKRLRGELQQLQEQENSQPDSLPISASASKPSYDAPSPFDEVRTIWEIGQKKKQREEGEEESNQLIGQNLPPQKQNPDQDQNPEQEQVIIDEVSLHSAAIQRDQPDQLNQRDQVTLSDDMDLNTFELKNGQDYPSESPAPDHAPRLRSLRRSRTPSPSIEGL